VGSIYASERMRIITVAPRTRERGRKPDPLD
jgi:hypothetical protein